MLSTLPDGIVQYSASPVFDENSVPDALLKNHKVKEGVWGRIVVFEGDIHYIVAGQEDEILSVTPSNFAIIEPDILHHVSLTGPVKFQVEFYRIEK